MRRTHRNLLATVAAAALAGGLVAAVPPGAPAAAQQLRPADNPGAALPSFANLIERVSPAVVQISAKQVREPMAAMRRGPGFPRGEDLPEPFREFLERRFGPDLPNQLIPRGRRAEALGSGFILTADGTVVTNNHVVENASEILVTFPDGRELPARLVGADDKTDLAVLKIDGVSDLPHVTWGASDGVRVGDWVIAVGNPFGLGGTATFGIVSARGRNIGSGPYDDFLQVDAPINRGNSGGPLFDAQGGVIGVNTAIFSPSGGSVGIGFAIPSAIASDVVADLLDDGRVERGFIGVSIQTVTREVAESLGLAEDEGALVAEVTAGTPAARAGVRQGDVILSFGGTPVREVRDLTRAVAASEIGRTAPLVVWRQGERVTLQVEVAEMPQSGAIPAAVNRGAETGKPAAGAGLTLQGMGLVVEPLDATTRQRYEIEADVAGVVIAAVDRDTDAAEKGLRPGDVIVGVNQRPVTTPDDLRAAVEAARTAQRDTVLLMVERDGQRRFVPVEMAEG